MATNTLLNYLRAVLKLETECRTLSISMKRNRQQAASLAVNPGIDPTKNNYFSEAGGLSDLSVILLLISIPLFAFYWWLCGSDDIPDLIHGNFTILDTLCFLFRTLIFAGPAIACIIGFFKCAFSSKRLHKEEETSYQKALVDNEQFLHEKERLLPLLEQDYQILKRHYNKICSTLQQYYDLNIIYPKYRGIIPVSMFVQYFASGRVSKLEGHTGAYNLYEQELLQRIIISKLDIVISRLDEIQSTQYELAQALQQSNQKITALSNRVDIANQHLEVQAYNSMQTNEEVKALKDYTIFRDLFR